MLPTAREATGSLSLNVRRNNEIPTRLCLVNKPEHRWRSTSETRKSAGPALPSAARTSGPPPPRSPWPSALSRSRCSGLFTRYGLVALLAFYAGCTIPVVTLKDDEARRYAVVVVDLESWLGSNMQGEFAFVSHIDGVWDEKYSNKKAGRTRTEGPLIKYVLIEPGQHDLTLAYNRNRLMPGGRKLWTGGVTETVSLASGRYFVRYQLEGKFVYLWLEDSTGRAVTERRKSVVAEIDPQPAGFVPIIISK